MCSLKRKHFSCWRHTDERPTAKMNPSITCTLMGVYITAIILILFPALTISQSCKSEDEVCKFKLVIEYHLTMLYARKLIKPANGKLYNFDDNKMTPATAIPTDKVISLDGYMHNKLVVTANGTVPGPPIEVYKGQTVIIEVENHLYSDAVTIHWHGLHQKGTSHMDGVPFVTQCPILPGQSFTYKFKLTQTGTYWYHSHMGAQRIMGLYGAFIIRDREKQEFVWVEDRHTMLISEHNHISDADTSFLKMGSVVYENGIPMPLTRSLDGSMFSVSSFHSGLVNGRGRYYNESGHHNGAPLTKFVVTPAKEHRFRVIAAGSNFPFEISVDDHLMVIVASDGYELEPLIADSFIIQPGERFDFIIWAEKPIGNYWIRGKTLETNTNHTFEAILQYEGAPDEEPKTNQKECTQANSCTVINCPFSHYSENYYKTCILLSELDSLEDHVVSAMEPGKSAELFLNFAIPGVWGHHKSPAVNGRVFKEPPVNALFQSNEIDTLCDNNQCGEDRLCKCTNILNLRKDDTVQMVFLNMGNGKGFAHPIHMHGHSFYLLKMGYPTYDKKTGAFISETPDINCRGNPRNSYCNNATWSNSNWGRDDIPGLKLWKPPRKDTIIIPSGGYAVLRIRADNPGMWFMHCHVDAHALAGMAMILNEAFSEIPPKPKNFPECRSFNG